MLEIDHIIPGSKGGETTENNLQTFDFIEKNANLVLKDKKNDARPVEIKKKRGENFMERIEKINKIKEETDMTSLIFTDFGNQINNNIGIAEIFSFNPKKNIIRKSRVNKNRTIKLKKSFKFNIKYIYHINLKKFNPNLNDILAKKNRIKIFKLSLLPNYEYPFISEQDLKIKFNYFENLKKQLEKKQNLFFTIRKAKVYHSLEIKSIDKSGKYPSNRKERKTIKVGDDYNRDRKKFVSIKRIIDRDTDLYGEEVKDKETNEIIRECFELLTEHRGRGNAKNK